MLRAKSRHLPAQLLESNGKRVSPGNAVSPQRACAGGSQPAPSAATFTNCYTRAHALSRQMFAASGEGSGGAAPQPCAGQAAPYWWPINGGRATVGARVDEAVGIRTAGNHSHTILMDGVTGIGRLCHTQYSGGALRVNPLIVGVSWRIAAKCQRKGGKATPTRRPPWRAGPATPTTEA